MLESRFSHSLPLVPPSFLLEGSIFLCKMVEFCPLALEHFHNLGEGGGFLCHTKASELTTTASLFIISRAVGKQVP